MLLTMKFVGFVMFCAFLVDVCRTADIPEFFHVCNKDDPNMNECFKKAGEEIRPYLVTGVPEHNIPSLEPLAMNDLIAEDIGGLHVTATDVRAYGCSNYHITHLDIDMDTHVFHIDVDLPQLKIETRYAVDGKILLIPIRGSGPMTANVTNCKGLVVLQGELYDKEGDQHIRFTSMTIKIKVGSGNVLIENLFGGEKTLGDVLNDTINKNFNAFLNELLPVIEKGLARVFLQIANEIVEPYTYKQLFPH